MKNNTRIRLHLSKQLFESLTKQVLAEAKVNDGYSEAVKQPKQAKETTAQKAAPEVKSTGKMKKMEEKMSSKEKMAKGLYKETDMEEAFPTAGGSSASKLGADMIKKGQAVKSASGLSPQEIQSIQAILDLIINKAPQGETAVALQKALTILTQNTKNVKADTGTSAKPAMPGLKEMGVGSGLDSANIGPGGVVVDDPNWHQSGKAEGDLNESEAVDAALTALGVLSAGGLSVAIMKLQDLLKKKNPKAYAALQKTRSTMGGANPGLDV